MAEDEKIRTADPERIKSWVEDRNGRPAIVVGDGERSRDLLFKFPGENIDQPVQEIGWDEFFEQFDERGLTFVYGEEFGEPGQDEPPIREKYDLVERSE